MNKYWKYFFFLLIATSCIEEFQIKDTKTYEGKQLVIQGRIASGGQSIFYISYSQPLGEENSQEEIPDASVKIVGDKGFQSDLAIYEMEYGYYTIDTKELSSNSHYAVQVDLDGKTYQSDFLLLQETPEIEDLTYTESEEGVSLYLKSKENKNDSPYYMWSYEEDWENHAPINLATVPGIIYPFYNFSIYERGSFTNGHNAYYYCWGHNTSTHINLYSTENLQKNKLNVELFKIPLDDIRISYIYSLQVKLYSLSNEAYKYYRTLKDYTEESSGLFPIMPTEIKGNVTCISHPSIKVQGYVLASNVKTKRIFIYESEFKHIHSEYESYCKWENPDASNKEWLIYWDEMIREKGAMAVTTNGDYSHFGNPDHWAESVLYHRECIDCRAVDGATKKRPDFWPNDHE